MSKRNQIEFHTRLKIAEKSNYKCYLCGTKGTNRNKLNLDHVVPKNLGGTDAQKNLALCCTKCNERKGNLFLTEYINRHGLIITKEIERYI